MWLLLLINIFKDLGTAFRLHCRLSLQPLQVSKFIFNLSYRSRSQVSATTCFILIFNLNNFWNFQWDTKTEKEGVLYYGMKFKLLC